MTYIPILDADEIYACNNYTDYRFYQKANGREYMAQVLFDHETLEFSEILYFSALDDGVSVFEEDQDTCENNSPSDLVARVKCALVKVRPILSQ